MHPIGTRHLSYANIMATIAVFLSLGGAAYASGYVGSDGSIHGCVAKGGALSVIKPGGHCTKGASLTWSQRGPQGLPGVQGPQGPGAVSFNTHESTGTSHELYYRDGVGITYTCQAKYVGVFVEASPNTVYVSGDQASDGSLQSVQTSSSLPVGPYGKTTVNLDVIAMANGTWQRFDLGGYDDGSACNIWAVVIPATNDPNIQ
jgi:hypothetical protein